MWLIIEDDQKEPITALALAEGETIIGSGVDCKLVIRGGRVSRKHVAITRRKDSVDFRDLDSQAGTLLNGEEKDDGALIPNDVITIDKTKIRLSTTLPEKFRQSLSKAKVAAGGTNWASCSTLLNELRSSSDQRSLLQCLLTGLISVLNAERGFVLLQESGRDELVSVATVAIDDNDDLVSLSSTIYKKALKDKDTVYIKNTLDSPICAKAASLIDTKARSILCGPLSCSDKTFGVLYLDAPLKGGAINEDAMTFFQSMTGLASRLLAERETREELLVSREKFLSLAEFTGEETEMVTGQGQAAQDLDKLINSAAPIDVTVLVNGETGVGKEVVARTIHKRSPRQNEAFIPINCAALPPELAEAILFGAEAGSYTGATSRRIGLVELASEGTLFLDEIGDLRLDLQTVLLRVLQDKQLRRVGGQKTIPVDFRLVCATNKNLEKMVREGSFRKDLFYRINVFRLELKPLRERREDILPLANHFLRQFALKFGRSMEGFTKESATLLEQHQWPGNVRELRNAIERAVVIGRSKLVEASALPLMGAPAAAPQQNPEEVSLLNTLLSRTYPEAQKLFEQIYIQRVLDENNGKVAAAARQAGVSRGFIYNRLDKDGSVKND